MIADLGNGWSIVTTRCVPCLHFAIPSVNYDYVLRLFSSRPMDPVEEEEANVICIAAHI